MNESAPYSINAQLLALCHFAGVPPRVLDALLRRYLSVPAILDADEETLREPDDLSDDIIERVRSAADRLSEAGTLELSLSQRDIGLTNRFEKSYPHILEELNDPPILLYHRGRLPKSDMRSVCLVGTRQASAKGIELTSRLAREFATAGVQVISSLVGGIDMAAHLACRTAGGTTFAVLDGGFDKIEGEGAMPIAIDIATQGGVISEYAPDVDTADELVPQVNRLLVGLAQAVVVTEVYGDSERILDLLQFCHDIGKLVFLMVDPESGAQVDEAGLKAALESGAILIEGPDRIQDIIKSLV